MLLPQAEPRREFPDGIRRVSDVRYGEGRQTSERHDQCGSEKRVEEPWASERVARFINALEYKEITLKSDTEPATVAFRSSVAEKCNADVATEDAVKGDKSSNGLVENAVMFFRGIIRTIKFHVESCNQEEIREDSQILPWLVEHARSVLSRCQKG